MNKSLLKKLSIFIVIVMAISLLLSFEKVGDTVGGWFGTAAGKVSNVAKTIFIVALGLFLISTGAAAMAVPVVGIALVVIGLVMVGYGVWPFFKSKSKE